MSFIVAFSTAWLSIALTAIFLPLDRVRRVMCYAMCPLFVIVLLLAGGTLLPWQRLLSSSLGLLMVIKAAFLLRHPIRDIRSFSQSGLALYMTLWPGVNPEPFRTRTRTTEDGSRFARGFAFFLSGLLLFVLTGTAVPSITSSVAGWYAMIAWVLTIHLGYADMLTTAVRLAGWNVDPLFEQPLLSASLHDFWSRRWNLAFVDMDRMVFLKPLKRLCGSGLAVFIIFLISGVLHDLCVSYSAGSGWGLPFIYFAMQGAAVCIEHRFKLANTWSRPTMIIWTWAWLLIPAPLLLTDVFRQTFMTPTAQYVHDLLSTHCLVWYFDKSLWLAAAGNFLTLAAGLQVPSKLHWRDELQHVSPFNRKIFLNYAAYVGLMIVAFGTLTIILHDELLNPDKISCALCILIGSFWGLRILVDMFWFKDSDWPAGPLYVIGHSCLTALFIALTSVYAGLAIWHLTF